MTTPVPPLPKALKELQLPTGITNKWLKILVYGRWKTGKSFFLKDFPPPVLGIDCGEGGLASYLPKPGEDPRYVCLNVSRPDQFEAALQYAIQHQDYFNSVIVDPITALWTDHMDWWNDELRGEIKGNEWRLVKGPWKNNLRTMMRAPFHMGFSAWVKETDYSEEETPPGVKGKLVLQTVSVPAMEKTVGYTLDLIFEASFDTDKRGRPNGNHLLTYFGGRRPRSVSPKELHVGRTWRFQGGAENPKNVWDEVIKPFLSDWERDGAEFVGIDPKLATAAMADLKGIAEQAEVGAAIKDIDDCKSLEELRSKVAKELQPVMMQISPQAQRLIKEKLLAKKAELQGGK